MDGYLTLFYRFMLINGMVEALYGLIQEHKYGFYNVLRNQL